MDVNEDESLPQPEPHPWLFALAMTFFLTILPWACSRVFLSRLADIYDQLDVQLPLMGRIILDLGMSYQHGFHGLMIPIPIGILASLLLVAISTTGYVICRDGNIRRIYSIMCLTLSIAWSVIFFVALFISLIRIFLPAIPTGI